MVAVVDNTIPQMDVSSAVFPTVRAIDTSLVLAFHLPGCTTSAIVRFNGVEAWEYGSPNDEGLGQHPLWGKGLTFYKFHQVHPTESDRRRWICTFHDGTFTVDAQSVEVICEQVAGNPWGAIDKVIGLGINRVLDHEARIEHARTSNPLQHLAEAAKAVAERKGS